MNWKRAAGVSISAAILVAAVFPGCAPRRPASVPETPSGDRLIESSSLGRLGENYLRRRQGILEARFAGTPYDRGYARGRLAYPEITRGQEAIHDLLERFVPSRLKRFFLEKLIALNLNESIPKIPAEHNAEIVGLSDAASPDPFPHDWNPFARHLALHALHDFSQRYVDDTPLAAACTGFVASGRATANRHTLLARNFDFEAGEIFDREKIVAYIVPERGIPYLSVTFGGLTGVTSGFNREGIGIAIFAWSGGPTAGSGEPATLVAADVLERARTLSEAVRIVQLASVFVSDIYLLADGKTGEMAAVEKTPTGSAVRRGAGMLLVANHPETPEFAGTRAINASMTSFYRRRRLDELVSPLAGRIGVPQAAAVLRDRRGLAGKEIGPGNRNAINGLIASHSVVFDLSDRRAWVAAAPHGLGEFVAYSLELGAAADPNDRRFGELASTSLPPDAWLTSGGYAAYQSARELTFSGRNDLKRKKSAEALGKADQALKLAPGFAEALALRAEALAAKGRFEEARDSAAEALARDPAPPPFARSLEALRAASASGRRFDGAVSYPSSPSDPRQE